MNISKAGIDLIKAFEGLRLTAYRDAVGVWTIGWGSTTKVSPGQTITETEAEALLYRDLKRFEDGVNRLITVSLTQAQFDALVSFSFNCGTGALESSTLRRVLNAGDYQAAADQLLRWNKAGGKTLAGLTRRREAERELFLSSPTPAAEQAGDPDGVLVDVPRLRAPFADTAATRLLASLLFGVMPTQLPDGWLDDESLTDLLRSAQAQHGLVQDGDCGAVTWAALTRPPQTDKRCPVCHQPIEEAA